MKNKIIMGIINGMFILFSPIATLIVGLIWIVCFILNKKHKYNPSGSILPTVYDDGTIEMNHRSYKLL
jgi:hypothetical protein